MNVILANGRGQLGSLLSNKLIDVICECKTHIYHTWNIDDKSKNIQKLEYKKFKNFVDKNKNDKIIFISTKSEKSSWYVMYKHLAESYLIQNCKNCLVLRFPTIVGTKGTLQLLKYKKIKPYGIMELMLLNDVCKNIIKSLEYDGYSKILSFQGQKISAELVFEMLKL
tara:strand:+ start:6465 stop:6968 length:504 start_codon:yes stop_codon:yes gene_type:complete